MMIRLKAGHQQMAECPGRLLSRSDAAHGPVTTVAENIFIPVSHNMTIHAS